MDRAHEVLLQLRELRSRLLARQLFSGYSGVARSIGGVIALLAGLLLSWFPKIPGYHLGVWGFTAFLACAVNYVALIDWFLHRPADEKKLRFLRPAFDVPPVLLVGGILTFAIIRSSAYELLFGTWMCVYGLVNISSHHYLPREITILGFVYIAAGAACFYARVDFLNPWPMALTFFLGELAGGWAFFWHRREIEGGV